MSSADAEIQQRLAKPSAYGGILSVCKFIKDRLIQQGLLRKQRFRPGDLGMYPGNRAGYGVNHVSVHDLGENIAEVGFDWTAIVDPLAVAEDPATSYIENWNKATMNKSEYLAPVTDLSIRAGTLTNGHLVQLLRAVAAGVKSDSPRLSVNGRMSLAQIEATDKEFGTAAREGWEWWVIDYRVRRLYGDEILMFLSGARNITLQREENEVQIMLAIFTKAIASPPENVDWTGILQSVLMTKPRCADTVPSILRFVRLFAGGAQSNFVSDFVAFHSMYVDNSRFISASFLDALCNLVIKPKAGAEVKAAIFRFAVLKAQYSCPGSKVLRSECLYISQTDLAALGKKNVDQTVKADSLLAQARALVIEGGASIPEQDRVRLFGKLDCAVVRLVCGKQKGAAKIYSCLEEILVEFYDDFKSLTCTSDKNPWESFRPKATSSSPVPPQIDQAMQTFTAKGEFVPIDAEKVLRDLNYVPGAILASKKHPDDKYTLMSLSDPVILKKGVHVVPNAKKPEEAKKPEQAKNPEQGDEAEEVTSVELKTFMANWSTYEEVNIPTTEPHVAATHHGLQAIVAKANIYLAMNMVSTSIGAAEVRLQSKPSKRVFAEKNFKMHECVLVAESTNIFVPTKGSTPPAAAVEVPDVRSSQEPDAKFYLSPPSMTPGAPADAPSAASLHSAFWCVRHGADADVNMERSFRKVSISIKGETSRASKVDVSIPVLVNKKPLKIGDELVVLKIEDPKAKAKASSKGSSKGSGAVCSAEPCTGRGRGSAAKRQRRA